MDPIDANSPDARAIVLLAESTPRQFQYIKELILAHGDATDALVDAARRAKPTPPLFAIVDTDAITARESTYILATAVVMLTDDIAAPSDEDAYSTALVRGPGLPEDDAEAIAAKIVTADAARKNAALRVLSALPDLPEIQNETARRAISGMVTESVGLVSRMFSTQTHWKDTLFEWMKLGEALFEYQKRVALQGVGYGVSLASGGLETPETGDPFDDEAGDALASDFGAATNQLLGYHMYPESGDPFIMMDSDRARDVIRTFNSMVQTSMSSPYHDYTSKAPEQGGLFSWAGKLAKKAAKAVKGVARKALPMLAAAGGSALGSMVMPGAGTLLGAQLGQSLGSGLSGGGGRRPAMRDVQTMAQTLPATPILSSILAMRQAPTGMPQRLNRPIAAGASGLLSDVLAFLQSRGYR